MFCYRGIRIRTLTEQGNNASVTFLALFFGYAFRFFSQNRSFRFKEVDSHLLFKRHAKQLAKAMSTDEVISLLAAQISHGVNRFDDSVKLALVERIDEIAVEAL